jgi:predicted nucleotidyltransferase component of viral defense system
MAILESPHWESISPSMNTLMAWIGGQEFATRFYLAGGTALALQMGYRRSAGLDFFSEIDQVHARTRQELIHIFSARIGQVICYFWWMDSMRVFFSYGYPLLEPVKTVENILFASLLDIGLMKMDAVIGRGSRKDFYDLYFINQQVPIAD